MASLTNRSWRIRGTAAAVSLSCVVVKDQVLKATPNNRLLPLWLEYHVKEHMYHYDKL